MALLKVIMMKIGEALVYESGSGTSSMLIVPKLSRVQCPVTFIIWQAASNVILIQMCSAKCGGLGPEGHQVTRLSSHNEAVTDVTDIVIYGWWNF